MARLPREVTRTVSVRLTDYEYDLLHRAAAKRWCTPTTYLKAAAMRLAMRELQIGEAIGDDNDAE